MTTPQAETEALLPTVGSHWLHRKSGGTYYVLAVGKIEADLIPAVVYQSTYDDKVWVRPLANFMDGRFEQTPDPRAALTPKPLSVAPDDEALFKRFRRAWTPNDTDAEEVLEALRRRIAELRAEVAAKDEEFVNADTRAALAKSAWKVGVSAQFLHDVLRGRRNANAEILAAIGYERVVTYRKKHSL